MSWLRKPARLFFDTLKKHLSKIKTLQSRNPNQPRTNSFSTHSQKPNFSSTKSIPSQPIFRNSLLLNFLNQNQSKRSVFAVSKRFYYVGRTKVDRFKDPRKLLIVVFIGSGVIISVYYGNLETVPYTKRTHFVLLSSRSEIELGEKQFNKLKADQYKDHILPPLHPESIRVQRIFQDIVDALQKGLKRGQVWSELDYSPDSEAVKTLSEGVCGEEEKFAKDEIIDEKCVEKTRKKGQEKRMKSQAHLEGLKWEVVVVNSPVVNAFCMLGGKIVVFTGLLNDFKTDAEVATIIGHEVGHAVARHLAERRWRSLWLTILELVLCLFVDNPNDVKDIENMLYLLLWLPFSRRKEMEADYIGLLLLASAGYDPRMAPQVYAKLGGSKLQDYFATHPSGKKRAQKLAHAKVMKKAIGIYKEVQAGRGIEIFP